MDTFRAYRDAFIRALVSSVVNSYAQCAAVAYRAGKTASWLANQGNSYLQNGTLSERIAAVSATTNGGGPIGLSGLDDAREEIYKPCATSNAATLTVNAIPPAVLTPANNIVVADLAQITATDAPTITAGINDSKDSIVGAVNGLNAALNARDGEAAARSLVRTITSGANALATSFRDGTLDAGVKIYIDGDVYSVLNVATGGSGVQTITVSGPAGAAVPATSHWYAIRRTLRRSDQARNKLQVLYQPPLGIFQVAQPMGSGSYKISLSPDPNFRLGMVETKDPGYALTGADTRYQVVVTDVKLYCCVGKLSIPDEIVQLDLMEYAAYSKVLQAKSQNLQFTVPASTETIYVALQHPGAGANPAYPPSKFVAANDSDLNLQSLQVSYANQTKTQTRWTSGFSAHTNALAQLYTMSLQETHRDDAAGGAESFNHWLDRGPVYAFRFDRDAQARDTELTVQLSYDDAEAGAFDTNSKLFIVCEYRRLVELTHSRGMITQVIARDV